MADFHSSPLPGPGMARCWGTVRQLPSTDVSIQPGKNSAARWLFA